MNKWIDENKVIELYNEKKSYHAIAKIMQCSKASVGNIILKYKDSDRYKEMVRQGNLKRRLKEQTIIDLNAKIQLLEKQLLETQNKNAKLLSLVNKYTLPQGA